MRTSTLLQHQMGATTNNKYMLTTTESPFGTDSSQWAAKYTLTIYLIDAIIAPLQIEQTQKLPDRSLLCLLLKYDISNFFV